MSIAKATSVILLSIALAGCGGGSADVTNTTVSEGQELIDLKRAYDLGVITEEEYEDERREIMNR